MTVQAVSGLNFKGREDDRSGINPLIPAVLVGGATTVGVKQLAKGKEMTQDEFVGKLKAGEKVDLGELDEEGKKALTTVETYAKGEAKVAKDGAKGTSADEKEVNKIIDDIFTKNKDEKDINRFLDRKSISEFKTHVKEQTASVQKQQDAFDRLNEELTRLQEEQDELKNATKGKKNSILDLNNYDNPADIQKSMDKMDKEITKLNEELEGAGKKKGLKDQLAAAQGKYGNNSVQANKLENKIKEKEALLDQKEIEKGLATHAHTSAVAKDAADQALADFKKTKKPMPNLSEIRANAEKDYVKSAVLKKNPALNTAKPADLEAAINKEMGEIRKDATRLKQMKSAGESGLIKDLKKNHSEYFNVYQKECIAKYKANKELVANTERSGKVKDRLDLIKGKKGELATKQKELDKATLQLNADQARLNVAEAAKKDGAKKVTKEAFQSEFAGKVKTAGEKIPAAVQKALDALKSKFPKTKMGWLKAGGIGVGVAAGVLLIASLFGRKHQPKQEGTNVVA